MTKRFDPNWTEAGSVLAGAHGAHMRPPPAGLLEPTPEELEAFWVAWHHNTQAAKAALRGFEQKIKWLDGAGQLKGNWVQERAVEVVAAEIALINNPHLIRRVPFPPIALLRHRISRGFAGFCGWIEDMGRPDLITAEMLAAAEVDRALNEGKNAS